jgi:hypothetical protein
VDLYFAEFGGLTAHGFNNDYSATARTAWTSSGGHIDRDLLFVDASSGNYRIRYASPCRNAGLATAPEVPATDFEGELRKQVDIGADEYPQASLPSIPLLLLD